MRCDPVNRRVDLPCAVPQLVIEHDLVRWLQIVFIFIIGFRLLLLPYVDLHLFEDALLFCGGDFISKVVPDLRLVSSYFISFGRKDGYEGELVGFFKDS